MSDEFTMSDLKNVFANPFYAININPELAGQHETMLSGEDWVKINLQQITETDDGIKLDYDPRIEERLVDFLHRLLAMLESGDMPVGYKKRGA